MATGSLAKSLSKLNLSQQHTTLFRRIVITGSQMASSLRRLDDEYDLPEDIMRVVREWVALMIALEHTLL